MRTRVLILFVFFIVAHIVSGNFNLALADNGLIIRLVDKNSRGSDEIVLRFIPTATSHFDPAWDMYKSDNDPGMPNIYSLSEGERYTINSMPSLEAPITIGVGSNVSLAGICSLSFVQDKKYMSDVSALILYDSLTNQFQDLVQNPVYTYTAAIGDKAERFSLQIVPSVITSNNISENNLDVNIASVYNQKAFRIEVSGVIDAPLEVLVYSVVGTLVMQEKKQLGFSQMVMIDLNSVKSGNYIVYVTIGTRKYNKLIRLDE